MSGWDDYCDMCGAEMVPKPRQPAKSQPVMWLIFFVWSGLCVAAGYLAGLFL